MGPEIAIAATVASTAISGYSQYKQGQAAEAQAEARAQQREFQAEQRRQKANQERAIAQRKAMERERQAEVQRSEALASSAAGGSAPSSPGIVGMLGDIEAKGEYEADVARYEGRQRAQDLRTGARLNEYEAKNMRAAGESKADAAKIGAAGTVLSGASKGFKKYDKHYG